MPSKSFVNKLMAVFYLGFFVFYLGLHILTYEDDDLGYSPSPLCGGLCLITLGLVWLAFQEGGVYFYRRRNRWKKLFAALPGGTGMLYWILTAILLVSAVTSEGSGLITGVYADLLFLLTLSFWAGGREAENPLLDVEKGPGFWEIWINPK